MRALASASASFLLLAACGGGVSSSTSNGGGPATGSLPIEGTFDVTFDSATATPQPNGGSPPPTTPPSQGARARIDVRRTAAGAYEAVVTGRWGDAAPYAVAVSDTALTLTGQGGISVSTTYGGTFDRWETITLARDAHGELDGTLAATGHESIGDGDVGYELDLRGAGRIARDVTAPELRAELVSRLGPPGVLLPWDPIDIRAAEPVDVNGVLEHTQLSGDHGDSLTLRWEAVKDDPTSWAGRTAYVGHVDDWTRAASGEPWSVTSEGSLA